MHVKIGGKTKGKRKEEGGQWPVATTLAGSVLLSQPEGAGFLMKLFSTVCFWVEVLV